MSVCIYSSRPRRRMGAAIAVSAFFICGAMAFSAVGLNNQLRRVFGLTALCLLMTCLLVAKRFLATAYSYAVYVGEEFDLVVYEHTLADKEPSVGCRIALSDIVEIRVVSREKGLKNKKTPREDTPSHYHNYVVSLLESKYVEIVYVDGEETGELRLSCDDGLLEILRRGKG